MPMSPVLSDISVIWWVQWQHVLNFFFLILADTVMKSCKLYDTLFLLSEYINKFDYMTQYRTQQNISTGAYSYYATFPFEQEIWAQFY